MAVNVLAVNVSLPFPVFIPSKNVFYTLYSVYIRSPCFSRSGTDVIKSRFEQMGWAKNALAVAEEEVTKFAEHEVEKAQEMQATAAQEKQKAQDAQVAAEGEKVTEASGAPQRVLDFCSFVTRAFLVQSFWVPNAVK